MDKEGNSLETLPPPLREFDPTKRQDGRPVSPDWPTHLDSSAEILRDVATMTALPHNVDKLRKVANDLELLAAIIRHPSNG